MGPIMSSLIAWQYQYEISEEQVANVVEHVVNDQNIDLCIDTETWLKDCDSFTIAGLAQLSIFLNNQIDAVVDGTGIMDK